MTRRGNLRRVGKWTAAVCAAAFVVCAARAATTTRPQFDPGPAPALPRMDPARIAEDLAAAIRVPTVSIPSGGDPAHFVALREVLRARFPRAHEELALELVGEHGMLLRWRGSDPTQPPIVLTAHLDVVPVEPGTESAWTHPAFAGEVADGYVWGRGAMDDKLGVVGLLHATETLLADGFRPTRDIWFGFGHDEEVGGRLGAVAIADALLQRGVRALFVLDEGGAIVQGMLPGIARPVALVGIAEKGAASFELVAQGEGGHSSMPPPSGAIGRLGAAVARLEAHQLPAHIDGPTRAMLDRLTPELGFGPRLVMANLWLMSPLAVLALSSHPGSNAIVRTTTAPTILEAGSADNVLAARARAVVNFRILPGDTVADVQAHVREVIDDDTITVSCVEHCWDPSPVSRTEGPGWTAVASAISWTWPDAIVSPSLVVGATDARHYARICDDVYRFLPLHVNDVDRRRLHGTDERIGIADLHTAVQFYAALIVTASR